MADSDRIEKNILLRAPKARVGKPVTGKITHPGYEHLTFEATVERMEAERLFSFRWHPYAAAQLENIQSHVAA